MDEPVLDYLTCYLVLQAAQDPRASSVLDQGYRLLQECAAHIEEEDQRRNFLHNVAANRDLLEVWQASRS
jgi:hypothetical protein